MRKFIPLLRLVIRWHTKSMIRLSAGSWTARRACFLSPGQKSRVSMGLGMLTTGWPESKALLRASEASHLLHATTDTAWSLSMFFLRSHILWDRSVSLPPPGSNLQWLHPRSNLRQPSVTWHIDVAGHISCIVHTTGFPDSNMRLISLRESIPWLIQCRCMMSASLNSRSDVMSHPVLAISISKRWFLEKWRWQNTTQRSHRKRQRWRRELPKPTTVICSVSLSRTSILAFTPLLLSASMIRLAASAAPPFFSLVFTISTLITSLINAKVKQNRQNTKWF